MRMGWQKQLRPGVALKGIVQQATVALVAMNAERLEELALCCSDLNRELAGCEDVAQEGSELEGAGRELHLLECILRETRANLTVLSRLHAIRLRETLSLQGHPEASRDDAEAEPFGTGMCRGGNPDYGDN